MSEEALGELSGYIKERLGDAIEEAKLAYGELTLSVPVASIISVLTFLRDDVQCQFVNLTDISGVDYPQRAKRFDVVYQLMSPRQNQRIRVKVQADEDTLVPSAVPIFVGAEWFERETYDMYGVLFSGHPDLRRILTDYGFVGHPFRKDFPLIGNVEVRYDEEKKRVVYEPVTSVEPRVGVPRVIRDDARFQTAAGESAQTEASK